MSYSTPNIPYAYDALEPSIDEQTMRIHHDKHHAGYTKKFNAAIEKHAELFDKSPEELLKDLDAVPEDIRTAVRNNGGGHVNHALFWTVMTGENSEPSGELLDAIKRDFGGLEKLKEDFSTAAATRFGSGWAWLVSDDDGKLSVMSTANQDSPLSQGLTPILCLDVWEHSYYLRWKQDRPAYIKAWWNVVNWEKVSELYAVAKQ